MDQPQKGQSSKRSQARQKPDQEMIGELARCVTEGLIEDFLKIEDPFECYAYHLKMRVYKDPKVFCSRLMKGYKILLEQVQSKKDFY